jgi:hypothetical protein
MCSPRSGAELAHWSLASDAIALCLVSGLCCMCAVGASAVPPGAFVTSKMRVLQDQAVGTVAAATGTQGVVDQLGRVTNMAVHGTATAQYMNQQFQHHNQHY